MLPFESSRSPIWNAAGTLGFAPPRRGALSTALGVFVTNPISWEPRTPAQLPRLLTFPGGVLLHTGLPNPGFRQVLRQFREAWARTSLPIVVHLIAESPDTVHRMVQRLEEVEGVAGIELGLPPTADLGQITELFYASLGELPVILCLPTTLPIALANALKTDTPLTVSLAPIRGTLPGLEANDSFIQGRLIGPGLFPQVLHIVRAWTQSGIQVIASGGIYYPSQAAALLAAGASAVQLDLRFWRESWPDQEWETWLESRT